MHGVPRIHYRPRQGATYEAPLDILIPALMKLRECTDSLKTLVPSGPETANTREIVASFAPGDFKVVDPDDIHVAPQKFVGKPIEIRNVRCFYADKDDYRCMAPSRGMVTAVFATSVGPANEKEALETDCGAIKKIESPRAAGRYESFRLILAKTHRTHLQSESS
jgi:hypothetical protein